MLDVRSFSLPAAALAAALALLCDTPRAGVIVVDAAGGGDHTTLAAAIAAAAEGDTLLVKPILPSGLYAAATVDGKSLRIVADVLDGTEIPVDDFIRVRNLAAGQQVVLRGLASATIQLTDNAGSVWLERCDVQGTEAFLPGFAGCQFSFYAPGGTALEIVDCASVTVVRSRFRGGEGSTGSSNGGPSFVSSSPGGPAVSADASSVALFECDLTGGDGGGGQFVCFGGGGVAGLLATGSAVLLSGCIVVGGDSGGSPFHAGPGVKGDAGSSIEVLDSVVAGGEGIGSADYATEPGTVAQYAGTARSFALTSPLREGQSGTLAMGGVQGDFVAFFWSFTSGSLPMPSRNGWFVLGTGVLAGPFLIGPIADPSGTWNFPMTGPNLPASVEGQTFLLQAYFQHPGGVTLASGTAFTLLDAGF